MLQPSPAPPALADDSPCEHKIRRNTKKSGSDRNSAVAEKSSLNKARVLFFLSAKNCKQIANKIFKKADTATDWAQGTESAVKQVKLFRCYVTSTHTFLRPRNMVR